MFSGLELYALRDWWQHRKQVKKEKLYNRGFNWAAGALLRKEETPMSIVSFTEDTLGYNAFDAGAEAALEQLIRANAVKDDRTDWMILNGYGPR